MFLYFSGKYVYILRSTTKFPLAKAIFFYFCVDTSDVIDNKAFLFFTRRHSRTFFLSDR